ncbi:Putative MetA-pathway of phenol degradation [Mesonia phycicola]|uniref:Putative MetA-pathway of phenol degradation n=1 Tax=Mesonia phycicola TaxID=579105 RepID=A0A1M6GYW2_9FLAO|nr:transporter [Mesonia phycicola]SHJ15117.1 Putative MetA-pathway of phenol degradation [Mesonia phycicola]
MKNIIKLALVLLSLQQVTAQEDHTTEELWVSNRASSHAPIGVMGDHTHHKGEFMVSYRYMTMQMKDLRYQDKDVSEDFVYQNYMIAPQTMTMGMHMLGLMYAPTDKLTFMAMANYTTNDMDLKMRMTDDMGMAMDTDFSTSSSGFGDVYVAALFQLWNKNQQELHGEIGFGLPTGSIEQEDVTPMSNGNDVILPYPMQIGSGSFSTKIGMTYLWQAEKLSGGAQANTKFFLNENDNNYRLGNQYLATSWLAMDATDFFSFSVRAEAKFAEEIDGSNPDLNRTMVTTANPDNFGGLQLNYALGANYYFTKNTLKGLRFGAEMVLPAYQEPNGIQLKQKYTLNLGTQYSF